MKPKLAQSRWVEGREEPWGFGGATGRLWVPGYTGVGESVVTATFWTNLLAARLDSTDSPTTVPDAITFSLLGRQARGNPQTGYPWIIPTPWPFLMRCYNCTAMSRVTEDPCTC